MFSVVRACLHGEGVGIPHVTSIHDPIGQSQITCPNRTGSNLFTWGPPPPLQYSPLDVQTCSLCSQYIYRRVGGWISTENLVVYNVDDSNH